MTSDKINILISLSEFGRPAMIISQLENDADLVDTYAEFSLTDHKYAWRAAWIINHYSKKNPKQLNKYADRYITALKNIERDGHLREIINTLINLKLSEEQKGQLFDICYELIQNNKRQSSVRGVCFKFMNRLAHEYPELKKEIKIIFDNIKDYISPGIRHGMEQRVNNEILTK